MRSRVLPGKFSLLVFMPPFGWGLLLSVSYFPSATLRIEKPIGNHTFEDPAGGRLTDAQPGVRVAPDEGIMLVQIGKNFLFRAIYSCCWRDVIPVWQCDFEGVVGDFIFGFRSGILIGFHDLRHSRTMGFDELQAIEYRRQLWISVYGHVKHNIVDGHTGQKFAD